ncbi:hypothetical protein V1280_003424 [Bradyrhizobium sp. AZCC 2230]
MSSLKCGVRGCAETTARRSISENFSKSIPRTSISTPAQGRPTGCICWGIPGVVCKAIAVQTRSMPACGMLRDCTKSRAAFAPSTSKRTSWLQCCGVSPVSWNMALRLYESLSLCRMYLMATDDEVGETIGRALELAVAWATGIGIAPAGGPQSLPHSPGGLYGSAGRCGAVCGTGACLAELRRDRRIGVDAGSDAQPHRASATRPGADRKRSRPRGSAGHRQYLLLWLRQ